MTDINLLTSSVRDVLYHFPLKHEYRSEQRDLQPHVQAALQDELRKSFPLAALAVNISVGGIGKPSLKLLGTSFWPDVEITEGNTPIAAIETKLVRPGENPSKGISEALGQAIIYGIHYPKVFALVVHFGRSDPRSHDEDAALTNHLIPFNVELVLRRREDNPAA
jgi:hypothetical protein